MPQIKTHGFKKWFFNFWLVGLFFLGIAADLHARYIVRPLDQAIFHNNQGVAYLNQQDPQKALFEFKTATELSPEFGEAWGNLGLTYMYLEQYDQAKTALLKGTEVDKKYPTPYNLLAGLAYNQGKYQEAIEWANQAIKRDNKFGDAYYNKGISYRELAKQTKDPKDYAAGEDAFRLATEANSRHYLANFELGNLYRDQGKTEQAIIRYKVALEIQPSATQVWQELGKLYLAKGQNDMAQFCFNKGMAAAPQQTQNHLSMGLLYLQEKNFALATKEFNAAYQENPNDSKALFNLAYVKLVQAEDIRARQGLSSAVSAYQEALQNYQTLLQKYPNSADAAYNMGYIYTRLNDFSQAEAWYQKALSFNPKHPNSLYGLGVLQIQKQQIKGGVAYLCQFLRQAGSDLQSSKDAAQKIVDQNGGCK